jgi:hypothetical protein
MWPFNRGWPLNGGPLNRGSTVYIKFAWNIKVFFRHIKPRQQLIKHTSVNISLFGTEAFCSLTVLLGILVLAMWP